MSLWISIVSAIVSTIVTSVMVEIARRAKHKPAIVGDAYMLEYSTFFRWAVRLGMILSPVIILAAAIFSPVRNQLNPWIVIPLAFSPLLPLYVLMLESGSRRLWIDANGLHMHSCWGRDCWIRWNDVLRVRYSIVNSWFIIDSLDGQRIRVHEWLTGMPKFVMCVQHHLPEERWHMAAKAFAKILESPTD